MKKTLFVALLTAGALAYGADAQMRPGLWEMHVLKEVSDGKDHTAQISGMAAQMQQAMASMPPEQRARVEAMMKQRIGGDGAIRVCISPEMAKRNTPVVDRDGHCQPANMHRDGDHMSYEISCSSNGTTTKGKGEATFSSDKITTRSDVTVTSASGTHTVQSEAEMRFMGADCGEVKPIG